MGGIVGGITDAIGLTDYKGQEEAARNAADAQRAATAAGQEIAGENLEIQKRQLEWQKEQYNDWKKVFGDLSENMGSYYKNLSVATQVPKQLANVAIEKQNAIKNISQQLAQRGLSASGVQAAAMTGLEAQTAMKRADIRNTAQDQIMAQKTGFLSLGLNQGTGYAGVVAQQAGNINSASNIGANTMLQGGQLTADAYMLNSNILGTKNDAMAQDIGTAVGFFSDIRLKGELVLLGTLKGINFYMWEWNKLAIELGLVGTDVGVIAQEVESVIPESVVTDTVTGYKKVDYSAIYNYIKDK